MPIINDPNYVHPRAKYLPTPEEMRKWIRQLVLWMNVERLRLYHGFSQTELAKKAGTTQAIISNIENGDYNPSLDLITRVATALEVKEDLLINDKINWIMLEMINYLMNKLPQKNIDILKAMKLVYFSDLLALKTLERKLSYLEYKRRHRGPFNKDIYLLDQLFKKEGNFYVGEPFATYLALGKEEKEILDQVAEKYGSLSSTELMKLSYETEPMKWCTVGGEEKQGEVIL